MQSPDGAGRGSCDDGASVSTQPQMIYLAIKNEAGADGPHCLLYQAAFAITHLSSSSDGLLICSLNSQLMACDII